MPLWTKWKASDEDVGEALAPDAIAGGGHGGEHTALQDALRASEAVKRFIAHEAILPSSEVEGATPPPALRELLQRPHAVVPRELLDASRPLTEYFISSSHNTYLLAHQLFGKSCPSSYETTLRAGAKCVEIDAWDNADEPAEPKVTHGYTLVSHIPFRSVCETIRAYWDAERARGASAPIFLSLENHCSAAGQERLVAIMREVFAHRLLDAGREGADAEGVRLADLDGKICVIVEYHWPDAEGADSDDGSSSSSSDSSEDEEAAQAKQQYEARKKDAPVGPIVPALAALGVYAQSVKPANAGWFDLLLDNFPHHHLINLSESGLSSHLPANEDKVRAHNAQYLMRVYPKGTRISSSNLNPVPFWHVGAQICALNWQRFGASLQLNEAMFSQSAGYVLKPAYMRAGGQKLQLRKRKLVLRIVGASDVPEREGGIKPYVSCQLVCGADTGKPEKRKTGKYTDHEKLTFLNDVGADQYNPIWDETLEWEFDDDELVFLRILLKSDDKFAKNPVVAAACIRLLYAQQGWNFVRLIGANGEETKSTLFIKLDITDV